jgi:folylpolyglutamate synthase/dihydropteroate synthase
MLLGAWGYSISDVSIKSGLGHSHVPGRFALLSSSPPVIFDPAHNPSAIETLVKSVRELYPGRRYTVVMSVMKDKDYARIFELISRGLPGPLYYFELDDVRCFRPCDGRHVAGTVPARCFSSLQELCDRLETEIDSRSAVIVTGTFRLYSAAKEIVRRLS